MKRNLLILVSMLATTIHAFSGTFADDPRKFSVYIEGSVKAGSGCIMSLSNSIYLVTVKHVLFSPQVGSIPPELWSSNVTLIAYSDVGSTNVGARKYFLNLAELLDAGEIRYSPDRDVAIVRIEECKPTNHHLVALLPGVTIPPNQRGIDPIDESMTHRIADIDVGAQVFMFGYPISLTGNIRDVYDPYVPLLRGGIVAGIDMQRKTVIIDSPSYQGNSGGPVIQVERIPNGTVFRLIGLVSRFVPFEEEWENKTLQYSHFIVSNSGYTIIEPMDTVLDLVWK